MFVENTSTASCAGIPRPWGTVRQDVTDKRAKTRHDDSEELKLEVITRPIVIVHSGAECELGGRAPELSLKILVARLLSP